MALPVLDKKADIPKGFEELYEEVDGEWHPIDQTGTLKKSLDEERDKRKAAEKAAKKATDEATEAKEAAAAAKAGVTDDQLKKLRDDAEAAATKKYEDKLKAAEDSAAALTTENRGLKLNRQVQELFAGAGVLPERLPDIWALKAGEFDLSEDGKPIVKGDAKADLKKHVATIVKAYPEWVRGTNASGGGAAGSMNGGGGGGGGSAADDTLKDPGAALRKAHAAGATS